MRCAPPLPALAVILTITLLAADTAFSVLAEVGPGRSKTGDIAAAVIQSLERGDLTEAQLIDYFEENQKLLRNNIEQARARHGKELISQIVKDNFARYQEEKTRIVSNYSRFFSLAPEISKKVRDAFGPGVPEIILMPCIGLFASNGWAQKIDDTRYVFVALESSDDPGLLEILLAHETAHMVSDLAWGTILDQFYNEGFACYVASLLCPGYPEEIYLPSISAEAHRRYLDWIGKNTTKIKEDFGKPFRVLDDYHKFYFTTSFNKEHPNIGYVIGYHYLKHLHKRYSLQELRRFNQDQDKTRADFLEFLNHAADPGCLNDRLPSLGDGFTRNKAAPPLV
jgi:hypothetical protein